MWCARLGKAGSIGVTTWFAVLVAGLGSYAFRVAPLLLGNRLRISARTQDILRHAGMGGMAALLASSVLGFGSTGGAGAIAAVLAAVGAAAVVSWRGRSMTLVVLAGSAFYAVICIGVALVG